MITAVRRDTPRSDDELLSMKDRLKATLKSFGVRRMTLAELMNC